MLGYSPFSEPCLPCSSQLTFQYPHNTRRLLQHQRFTQPSTSVYALSLSREGWEHVSMYCVHNNHDRGSMLRTASKQVYSLAPAAIRSERARTVCDKGRTRFANTVRKREAKLGLKELSNVRPSDILRLFNFHDAEDLQEISFST